MKVTVGNATYLMHWEARKFSPKEGHNTSLELEATDCFIRQVLPDGTIVNVANGHVSQTYGDQANGVTARRLSFIKAIKGLPREVRKALGHEYNRVCRVVSRTHSDTTRKLKNRIKILEDVIVKNGLTGDKVLKGLVEDVTKSEEVNV